MRKVGCGRHVRENRVPEGEQRLRLERLQLDSLVGVGSMDPLERVRLRLADDVEVLL